MLNHVFHTEPGHGGMRFVMHIHCSTMMLAAVCTAWLGTAFFAHAVNERSMGALTCTLESVPQFFLQPCEARHLPYGNCHLLGCSMAVIIYHSHFERQWVRIMRRFWYHRNCYLADRL